MSEEEDTRRHMVTLGMFIIDEFSFMDENQQTTNKTRPSQESYYPYINIICILSLWNNTYDRLAEVVLMQ
jgi:hypothetical protein